MSFSNTGNDFALHERPTKKRRLSFCDSDCSSVVANPPNSSSLKTPSRRQVLLEEIDLEISLRQRLAETARSRLTWALLLQDITNRCQSTPGENGHAFRDATLDALCAVEAPCNVLFTRDIHLHKTLRPLPATTDGEEKPATTATSFRPPYTTTGSTRTRGVPRIPRPPPKKLLFLRNNATNPPQIAKLACPDCSRSDFSNLQGLLNHCRLRHKKEYGSHDECVQNCAVLVEGEEDQVWIVANGTEVAGISLPGLRRLFEMAVGGGDISILPPTTVKVSKPEPESVPDIVQGSGGNAGPPEEAPWPSITPSTEVARTLGVHEDSPALAQLLGRTPKKRCINAYNEDDLVDIFSVDDRLAQKPNHTSWRMSYAPRSKVESWIEESVDHSTEATPTPVSGSPLEENRPPKPNDPPTIPSSTNYGAGSRFHIAARICVEDRSMYIPQARRIGPYPNHTHRWRLTISSPSYSLPISTVLQKLTISCLSESPPPSLANPITLNDPPFVITSTSDKAFLAGLTFTWAGTGSGDQHGTIDVNQVTSIEHWVELDPLYLTTAVLGDEQVFDVELDRNTVFLPVREDRRVVSWDQTYDSSLNLREPGGSNNGAGGATSGREQMSGDIPDRTLGKGLRVKEGDDGSDDLTKGYGAKLKSLLHFAPLTLKDAKGRSSVHSQTGVTSSSQVSSTQVPYLLVPSTAHLRNLVHGRRKAIEWTRARTLLQAYERHFSHQESHVEIPTLGEGKQVCKGESEYPSLSVSDVYRWLESQGHFPRDSHPRHVNPKRRTQQKTTHLPTDGVTTADQDSVFSGPVGADRSYCRHCGLHYRFHPSLENSISGAPSPQTNVNPNASVVVKQEPIVPTMPTKSGIDSPGACMHFDKVGQVTFPMVDVRSMLDRTQIEGVKMEKETLSRHPSNDPSSTVNTNSSPLLVSLTDPKLVKAIHRLASTWRLPHFPLPLMLQPLPNTNFGSSSRSTTIPIEHRHQPDSQGELGSSELAALHTPKREFESQLGPSALLGLLLRPMAKLLLQTGVEIYQKDESAHELVQDNRLTPKVNINADPMTGQVKVRKRRGLEVVKKDDGNHRRVLTASHIVRGLLESGGADTDVRRATCILLSRMGLSRDDMGFE